MSQEQFEGMESQVSDDAFEGDPVLMQYQTEGEQEHWLKEIEASRKERERFTEVGMKVIKRYSGEDRKAGSSDYNIFFANTEIKQAAIYARTPVPDISRRFLDSDDQVSRVASGILQRNLVYELEAEGFDAKFKQITFDRLVPGVGVGWARLEQDIGDPIIDAATGLPIPGSEVQDELASIDYVAWNDFFWSPCVVWSDCPWVARRVRMTKPAVKDRFGDTLGQEGIANLSFTKSTAGSRTQKDVTAPKNSTQSTIDVFEIWDKERRLVFWITESSPIPLDVQKDANDFPDFFPTPLPPLGRFNTSSTTPISDFSLVQDQYNELDNLNTRCTNLVRALQLKWVYDSQNKALADLFTTGGELQGIPVKDWAVMQSEKGGIRGAMEFVPLDETAATYQKLIQARDVVKQQIYEIEGISDILRGAATPYESAAATNAKSSYSSSRLSVMQHQVADYIARLLRLKAHLICKFYKPETILARAGQGSQADQQFIGQAIELLKNEQLRHFRLNVSVDSIQLENWDREGPERIQFIGTISNMIGQALPAVKQTPELAPLVMSLIKFGVAGYKGSQVIEGEIDAGLQQLVAAKAQNQGQPPQPTPEQVKAQAAQAAAQASLQKTQMQEQTKLQIAQMQAQLEAQAQQLEQFKAIVHAKEVDASIQHHQEQLHIDRVQGAHAQGLDLMGGQ